MKAQKRIVYPGHPIAVAMWVLEHANEKDPIPPSCYTSRKVAFHLLVDLFNVFTTPAKAHRLSNKVWKRYEPTFDAHRYREGYKQAQSLRPRLDDWFSKRIPPSVFKKAIAALHQSLEST